MKLTIEQNIKYSKNKIVWNGLETISYLRPNIFSMASEEMKKSVKLAGVEIPLQAITITTSKNSRAIQPRF